MKAINIKNTLDRAWKTRLNGGIFNPLFIGDAGLGKSFISQQWAADQKKRNPNFFILDLRIAYFEAPDMIGFPKEVETGKINPKTGLKEFITTHCVPEFWMFDHDAEGLILLEEPNRGTIGVMNCLMQLLTDRKIHNVKIPENVIIAACINPDSTQYDVNSMDMALKNRFISYDIEFDHKTFIEYIEEKNWHQMTQMFLKSGIWIYKDTDSIGDTGTYISPRTWEQINDVENAGLSENREEHYITVTAILGRDIGKEYHTFYFDESPITVSDILKNKRSAIKKLIEQSSPENYKGDMIGITVDSIINNYVNRENDDKKGNKIGEKSAVDIACVIPSDQAVNLIKGCCLKSGSNISKFFTKFKKTHPKLIEILKTYIKVKNDIKK